MKAKSKVTARFTDNKDGTVTDSQTNLVWAKEDDGVRRNWKDAVAFCKKNSMKLPGKGWRLPTREELLTIVDLKRYDPAADPIFKAKSAWYWSSTPYAGSSDYSWIVFFGNGYVYWYYQSFGYCVRPVRQNS